MDLSVDLHLQRSVGTEHSVWQNSQWRLVDCQEVEEATVRQMDAVDALPSFTQSWDVYKHLVSYLHTTQVRVQSNIHVYVYVSQLLLEMSYACVV